MQAFSKFRYSITLFLSNRKIHARVGCEQWIGRLVSANVQAKIRRVGSSSWRLGWCFERLSRMDAIRNLRNTRAVVNLNSDISNNLPPNLDQKTSLTFKSWLIGRTTMDCGLLCYRLAEQASEVIAFRVCRSSWCDIRL